jgi:hypothetical protein
MMGAADHQPITPSAVAARIDPLPPEEFSAEFGTAMAALHPPNPWHQPLTA